MQSSPDPRSPAPLGQARRAGWRALVAVMLLAGWSGPGAHGSAENPGVSLGTLLEELADRDRLSRLPDPAYRCRQASSYDRRSTDPGDPTTWYANMDRSYFVRTETHQGRTEYVMMDEAGPGALVRFWATWHGPGGGPFSNGTLRFYLDGKYVYSIHPQVAWDVPAYIQMAVETYDWNPIPRDGGLVESGTREQRTTQYEWVRTWKLVHRSKANTIRQ